MKNGIHPEVHPVCFIDVSTGTKFFTKAALRSKQKEVIDGVEYYVVHGDVTSDSHPVYTGEKRFVDTAGRVEKVNRKFSRTRA
jgi:large subunit ribosomal protein L31